MASSEDLENQFITQEHNTTSGTMWFGHRAIEVDGIQSYRPGWRPENFGSSDEQYVRLLVQEHEDITCGCRRAIPDDDGYIRCTHAIETTMYFDPRHDDIEGEWEIL